VGRSINFSFSAEETRALNDLALRERTTLYILLLSVINVYLSKLGGMEDIIVGTPLASRRHSALQNMMGMFVKTLALRNYPRQDKAFRDFLLEVKERTLTAFENREYPFEDLVGKVLAHRDPSRNPLFDVMFELENMDISRLEGSGLTLTPYLVEKETSLFDITFIGIEVDKELCFTVEYCTGLFKEETVKRFIGYFRRIAAAVIENHHQKIYEIDIVSTEEKEKLLCDFNDIQAGFPVDKSIPELFAEQVEKTSDGVALVGMEQSVGAQGTVPFNDIYLTYRELNEKSGQLAHYLRQKGVTENHPVGIMVEKSVEMIIGMLGILKAGGAYIPLNSKAPAARSTYILDECRVSILLTVRSLSKEIAFEREIIYLDDHPQSKTYSDFRGGGVSVGTYSFLADQPAGGSSGFAYVIFTSGSTGKPKGVPVTHSNLSPLLHWGYRHLGLGTGQRTVQNLAYYFDWSVWEIFITLTTGAVLYTVPEAIILNPRECIVFMTKNDITVLHMTPSQFLYLVNAAKPLETLRYLFLGAEKLAHDLLQRAFAVVGNNCRVFNMYGPTEAAIISAVLEIAGDDLDKYIELKGVPIGKPVGNTGLLVLDRYLNLCPHGVMGELYIAGDGVAAGYLNNPELTGEKFIKNPYTSQPLAPGKRQSPVTANRLYRTYRTGDLSRRLPDGNIQFLGRIDFQVKIRGFRVEPGEVEAQLMNHGGIREAVVLVQEDAKGEKYLCAYTAAGGAVEKAPGPRELKEYLAKKLPDYMIPSYFIQVERIPLTPNGKLDRKALPTPGIKAGADYIAPGNEIEEKLVEIWSEILGVGPLEIGIDDNFFELGGHSLKGTVLLLKVHKRHQVPVPLTEFFKRPTVRGLAEYILSSREKMYEAVAPAAEQEYYLQSPAQRRLFFLYQFETIGIGYNLPVVFKINIPVDESRMEAAFKKLIQRHESLRTSFHLIDGQPVQEIHEDVEFEIEVFEGITGAFVRPFDLSRAPLMRVGTVSKAEDECLLLVDMHHIITDGISRQILMKDFLALVEARELEPLRLQYKDFSQWQNSKKVRQVMKKQEKFWLGLFAGEIPVLSLPMDYVRPAVQDFAGSHLDFDLVPGITGRLFSLARQYDATLYMVLLAVFNVLLHKLSGREDIVVGTPTAARRHTDLENIIGMFVNTLAMRNYPQAELSFSEFLEGLKARTLEAYENQEYQFEELVDRLALQRDVGRNPLFDVVFSLHNQNERVGDDRFIAYDFDIKLVKFDLELHAFESEDRLNFSFYFCTTLYKEETVKRFSEYFKRIAAAVIERPDQQIFEIDIVSREEKEKLLYDFNDTEAEYPEGKTIHELFEEQSERTPDGVAVVCGGWHPQPIKKRRAESVEQIVGAQGAVPPPTDHVSITYKELDKKTNQLARLLIEKGVLADDIVAIMMERSLEMIIGILGILKAGGAYLPIDPGYPEERKQYMLADSGARILLKNLSEGHHFHHSSFITHHSGNLAYVIYTSGTTGKPKGVMVQHRNVVRLMFNDKFQFDFSDKDVWTLFHSHCFDFSVWEMYGALLYGGKLVVVPRMAARDTERFLELLKEQGVTVLNQTPSAFYPLVAEELKQKRSNLNLKYVIFGGEALNPLKLKEWKARYPGVRLINMFGITETTVHVTYKEITAKEIDAGISNIGKPIPTLSTYVLDKYRELVPIGVSGELCVGGAGVARGYLNRPELTAEKFDQDLWDYQDYHDEYQKLLRGVQGGSFLEKSPPGRRRLYRSGDLARLLPGGDIEYLGRIDTQVQVRGHRVEPGEIANRLLSHHDIKDAVVIERTDKDGGGYLCAYIVAAACRGLDAGELRQYLSRTLPDYMIPSFFVSVDSIPLTPNGKLDRKALPAPEIQRGEGYEAPRNELENKLVEIWSEVLALDKDRIGIDANFFELGGHSLKVTVMTAKVHEELGVKVPLTEVFITPFIRGLAQYIHTADREQYAPLEPVGEGEYYDASYAQHRLWIICQFEDESTAYNIPGAFIIEGELDIDGWEWALQQLVKRHDGFRTAFISINGGPKQTILKHLEFKPVHVDLRELVPGKKEEKAKNLFTEVANKPFNLERAPLFRVTLARLEENRYLLIFNMHHIVSDAWSLGTLVRDFSALYNGFPSRENKEGPLLPLRFQYKDYAAWHNRLVESDTFSRAEHFWLEKFNDKPNGMELPLDHSRQARQTFNGGTVNFMIDRETSLKLKALCLRVDATLFMGLLAVLHVLLYKYTGQADIIIGLPEVGRRRPELYDIVGFFVNTLVYRHSVEPGEAFAALLEKVKKEAVDCYQHQDYPFNMLVEKLELDRDISQSPLFNVMLSHNNTDVQGGANEWRMEGVTVRPYAETDEFNMSVFDLIFFTREFREVDHVDGFIMYNSDLFDRSTIERMARNLQTLVEHIVNHSSQPVQALNCLSPGEYETIIYEFNNNDYDYPQKTVQELFEEQVLKSADDTAAVYNEGEISYNDLNRQANRLAHYLREECGIRPNHIAAIAIDRSLELIIAILGILKSGGGYLSIDPNYPGDRVLHMLIDSRCRVLIQDKARPELFGNYNGRILHILDDWQSIARQPADNPGTVNSMGDTIYVIYTSGSTGTPNGAMLSQDLLANLIRWQREKTAINDSLRCLQFTTTSFCVSFQEIMMTLTSGGQLYLIGEVERQDIDYLMDFLSRNKIENLYLPFSYLNFLFNESNRFGPSFEHSLKHIITAGEQLKITSGLKTFLEQNPRVQLHNHYGSSEMHVVTSYTLDAGTASVMPVPPAGKPIANTEIYILDEHRHPVPIGVWGELCIAGCSEVPGYINNKTLTGKKLLKHPLLPPGDNKRLYISGDIGRWLPDGNIELKGRKDSQVKIRGFRVELSEIESKILAVDRVKDCVVEVKTDKQGQKFLVAYVVKENIDVSEIKRIINAYLPQHMVPQFMALDSLPLMPNGKVDRERLPDPGASQEPVRQVDTRQISRLLEEGQFKTIPWPGDGIFFDKDALENFLAHLVYIVGDEFLGERLPLAGVDIEMLLGDRVFAGPPSKKEPVLTVPRRQISDFDSLSIPDRSLVDYEKYGKRIGLAMVKHTISIQATRGCPYNCLYCHKIWPRRHVVRSAAHISKELRLYYNMGFRRFVFVDDIFNLDVKNSKEFFRMIIDNGLDVQLFFPNGLRTDLLTRDYIDLMVEAGTVSLGLALETASPRVQELIEKNMNLDKLRENVEYLCEKYPRVILELFLMHGFPTETGEEACMTLDFLKRLKWVDFPYYHLLKIYPHTDMAEMAVQNGIPEQAILNSANLAFHELPETLPFEKSFTLGCQTDFLNNYFLLKERLLAKLPYQMKVLTDDEIVQKYNSYLPVSISTIDDLLDVVGIKREELAGEFLDDRTFAVTGLQGKMREHFPASVEDENGLRVLLLDTSQFFTRERDILYDGVEPPLGLMYLLTYLQREFGSKVTGKIAKSRIDFDNFAELRILLEEFQPDVIGIRTLTYYKNLFHQTVSWIRRWGFTGPLIAGGPYATSDYETVLQDKNIDLVVMSEGEITFAQLAGKMIANGGQLPLEEELKTIDGIAFVPGEKKSFPGAGQELEWPAASCILPRTQGQVLEALVRAGPSGILPFPGDGGIGLVEFYKKQESEAGEASLFIRLRVDGSLLEGEKTGAGQLPRDETEEKLAEIWANVLGIEKQSIAIEDNFFELGGHSLKATTMVSQIHKELNVKVPLVEMFKSPTIRGLADYIRGMAREQFTAVKALENKEYYPLSSAQQRMYIRQQLKPEDTGYNNPTILLLEGELNKKKLEETFMYLIRRHESLRTSFETVNETPVQVIHNKVDFEIEYCFLATKDTKRHEEVFIRNFVHPFDLTKTPLLRAGMIEVEEKKHILMFDMHHIITDGVSLRIFAEEFMALYSGEELSDLRLQYRDFTRWQNRLLASGEMEKQEAYWLKRFAGDIPVLEIPTDFPRPSLLGGEGGNVSFEIDGRLTAAIKQVGAETDATVFMVLLGVCNILLGKYSGQEDITIGSSIAGRRHADLENIIGMFVNMLAMRNRPAKDKTFLDFLKEVRENAFDAYGNQDVQFDELVRKLELQGNPGRNPLFDVVFKLQNMDIPEIIIPGLVLKPYGEYNEPGARFDLVIGATGSGEKIIMDFNYSSDLFKRSTIEDMTKHFLEVLEQVLENPRARLKDIDISMKLRPAKSGVQKEETVFGF
jgi:tyrocidine synthetase-3